MSRKTEKKYEFTGETLEFEGHILKRIRYLTSSMYYDKGELGGWIESEFNLSHEGSCGVVHEAKVFGNARVMDDSLINQNAILKDNAQMKGDSFMTDEAIMGGDSIISDDVWIRKTSKVFFYAQANDEISKKPHISGDSCISGASIIEATGSIKESMLYDVSLYGELNLVDIHTETFTQRFDFTRNK